MDRFIGAVALLLATIGGARADYVSPRIGLSTTLAEIGGNRSYSDPNYPYGFHVLGGVGTPGVNATTYNPSAWSGPTRSAVSGYDRELSGNGNNPVYATGSAAADLDSGQMHVVGQAVRLGTTVNNTSVASIAASAVLADVITIQGPISAPITIRISMVVDGSITGSPTDLRNGIAVFALNTNGGGSAYSELFLNQYDGVTVQEQDASTYGGKVIKDSGIAASLHFTLYNDVVVTEASRRIPFLATASVNLVTPDSPGVINADFGNTARLQIALPDGLSFTSQSGVLLTQAQDTDPTAVPEPASVLLLGLAALGASARRRQAPKLSPGA